MTVERLSPGDPNSFSRPEEVCVKSIHLDLDVDFKKTILTGSAKLKVERKKEGCDLILDTRDLTIHSVVGEDGEKLEYTLDKPVFTYGSKLTIKLPQTKNKQHDVLIHYDCSPKCTALQWLKPEQTAGKKHPYLYSHCEAIHCRSMAPCQDTPSLKATFTAEITAPSELTVLMGALREGEPQKVDGDRRKHKFNQPIPIASYLIAIAVGALESRQVGPRSHVWSEKEMVDKAAWEFAETEDIIKAAESIVGPYVWGIYDILVLPPSFPLGGMENPCLTFATPTVVAGDKSMVTLIAHEAAHSWTGNLVTNKTFEHFWLNEGFTMFLERKIQSRLSGEKERHFGALGGVKNLRDCIQTKEKDDPLTMLNPNLTGVDLDVAFSIVPYEKGHTFLFYLEEKLGGPEEFDKFLLAYIENFKYQSVTTQDFLDFLMEFFKDKVSAGVLADVDWDTWLKKPGMPPVIPNYDTSLSKSCIALCAKWVAWDPATPCPFNKQDIASFNSNQIEEFLSLLFEEEPLPTEKVKKMEEIYSLNERKNSDIRFMWIRLCIRAKWEDQAQRAVQFMTEQGRMKYIRPLYRDLFNWDKTKNLALQTYHSNKDCLMHVASTMVARDLKLSS